MPRPKFMDFQMLKRDSEIKRTRSGTNPPNRLSKAASIFNVPTFGQSNNVINTAGLIDRVRQSQELDGYQKARVRVNSLANFGLYAPLEKRLSEVLSNLRDNNSNGSGGSNQSNIITKPRLPNE